MAITSESTARGFEKFAVIRRWFIAAFIFPVFSAHFAFAAQAMDTPPVVAHIDSVLVAVPRDGSFDGKDYYGSGHFVAHRVVLEFAQYVKESDIAPPDLEDREALLAMARKANDAYLVVPAIVRWEYLMKGKPSHASINMTIIKVDTGEVIQSTLLDADSPIMVLHETNPDVVATGLIRDYVKQLYGH